MYPPEAEPDLEAYFSVAYEELRRLAGTVWRERPSETLNPTALVNEAYVKLARAHKLRAEGLLHFKRMAARAMRRVLVEAARRRSALKRGGGAALVTFDDALGAGVAFAGDVLTLDDLLDELRDLSPRQCDVVECRFFGGFDVAETADILGVSKSTVERDWRATRAWLGRELRGRS